MIGLLVYLKVWESRVLLFCRYSILMYEKKNWDENFVIVIFYYYVGLFFVLCIRDVGIVNI